MIVWLYFTLTHICLLYVISSQGNNPQYDEKWYNYQCLLKWYRSITKWQITWICIWWTEKANVYKLVVILYVLLCDDDIQHVPPSNNKSKLVNGVCMFSPTWKGICIITWQCLNVWDRQYHLTQTI